MKKFKEKKYSILLKILKYSFVFILGFTLVANFAFAVMCPDGVDRVTCSAGGDGTTDEQAGFDGTNITTKINNPLGPKLTNIPAFIHAVVEIVLVVGIPIIALAIIYTGLLFVMAQGNSEKITKAKKALMYVLIGAALLLGAFVIANAIQSTVDEIKN
ncbi:TPA: hypothetical protein DCX66_03465 [Candidatus Nomurabacteria bacterium]|uniref:Uncharacterized protein n=1 Tax=Candidatus Nomurabacteria bacterium GW2011_GWE1_35_16 TaxID=1618761 RepID=A0A0G0BBU8_9BACT|nr:MAG: hypothetical protein UR55_C0001G0057 [Candidatus Nomurabacteria bacterium GW2011_GWF1_34_20]KKP63766.1 MAG: hypothetical protein UR57_C0001G0057 [Candidatus Nomurabacteria bacterium GW2011_GWE2_34_25]KKP66978.1 MAG: hypothetical protein UR64_C0001G0057 [Candidatus Nomurabacteria bacterium GW2011_GWE1_35_16]HAE36800.1 hypothetical protein [Candidatus Nomurabacteria bacterium]HAX65497.1 hypothetical protein [Candidatus Nomurabacteria bacterium]